MCPFSVSAWQQLIQSDILVSSHAVSCNLLFQRPPDSIRPFQTGLSRLQIGHCQTVWALRWSKLVSHLCNMELACQAFLYLYILINEVPVIIGQVIMTILVLIYHLFAFFVKACQGRPVFVMRVVYLVQLGSIVIKLGKTIFQRKLRPSQLKQAIKDGLGDVSCPHLFALKTSSYKVESCWYPLLQHCRAHHMSCWESLEWMQRMICARSSLIIMLRECDTMDLEKGSAWHHWFTRKLWHLSEPVEISPSL